jgi:hypothetical protein
LQKSAVYLLDFYGIIMGRVPLPSEKTGQGIRIPVASPWTGTMFFLSGKFPMPVPSAEVHAQQKFCRRQLQIVGELCCTIT